MSVEMISRRQIISRGRGNPATQTQNNIKQQQQQHHQTQEQAASSKHKLVSANSRLNQMNTQDGQQSRNNNNNNQVRSSSSVNHQASSNQIQANFGSNDSSDGYAVNPYEEYGFANDLLDDEEEDEIENDYEDGDGYADFDQDNDPYGRVGDFAPRNHQPFSTSRRPSSTNNDFYWQQRQQQAANSRSKQANLKMSSKNNLSSSSQLAINSNAASASNNVAQEQQQQFDPYAIYAEEEDVWYSEERLLEDHLAEIFNRWDTLDDDIWCKLIIMERNRRIGKAYARVPLITIDGSYQLSYDGEKLALNGFDNPDRDSRTEECRRRIGKGIRIKMDNFGNVLITRRTKANIFIKEWLPLSALLNSPPNSLGDSSSAGSSSGVVDNYHHHHLSSGAKVDGVNVLQSTSTPSRQQVIKNQQLQQRSSAAVMQPLNDSAICQEVISVGGRLEWEKIYVMFDMKKFQANITQELCQQFPDKRKLEQQCVSIVGLVGDSDEILNLPCWLMVINIVAIEILNERFPRDYSSPYMSRHLSATQHHNQHQHHGNTRSAVKQPSFLSIFDQQQAEQQQQQLAERSQRGLNNEEDPYSLPANASSSDVKSSINDGYGTTSTKYQHISSARSNPYQQQQPSNATTTNNGNKVSRSSHQPAMSAAELKSTARAGAPSSGQRGVVTSRDRSQMMRYQQQQHTSAMITKPSGATSGHGQADGAPYNNSTSIYSPGHMLVLPPRTADGKPPKLPPRDFSKMAPGKLATGAAKPPKKLRGQNADESIYSTGLLGQDFVEPDQAEKPRVKSKKNRFLESLKAPLMNSSKSSSQTLSSKTDSSDKSKLSKLKDQDSKAAKLASSEKPAKTTTKSSLKSFLGVKSSSASTSSSSGASSSLTKKQLVASSPSQKTKDMATSEVPGGKRVEPEVYSSVLDSTGDHSSQPVSATSRSSSFNDDLDIPTPDYETDENIYAIGQHGPAANKENLASKVNRLQAAGKLHHKDDLYQYSAGYNMQLADEPKTGQVKTSARENSRFMLHNKMLASTNVRPAPRIPSAISSSQLIYGSTLGLSQANPSVNRSVLASQKGQFRSASMQRSSSQQRFPTYAPSSIHSTSAAYQAGAAAMSASSGLYQQQHQPHYGQGKYASPLHPAYAYNQQRYRHHLDPDREIYGQSGHVALSSSSQQQLAENPYAMGRLRGQNYASSMLNGPAMSQYQQHLHLQQQQHHHQHQQQQQMTHRTRRRSLSRLGGGLNDSVSGLQHNPALLDPMEQTSQLCPTNCCTGSNYDIGRSSSGIYGNNSSSSSSDYVDWHPQMRKVNSSGYLNSIFKNHHLIVPSKQQAQQQQHQSSSTTTNINSNNKTSLQTNGANNNGNKQNNKSIHDEDNNNHHNDNNDHDDNLSSSKQLTTITSSKWKSAKTTTTSSNNNNNNNHNNHQDSNGGLNSRGLGDHKGSKKPAAAAPNATAENSNPDPNSHSHPNYRLYDSSSNDSYTNSSDGLDIYDRIGQSSRLASNQLHHKSTTTAAAAANQMASKQQQQVQVNHQGRRTLSQTTASGSVVSNGARMLQQQHHDIGNSTTKTSNSNHEFLANSSNNHHAHAAPRHNLLASGSEIHVGEWENMYDR